MCQHREGRRPRTTHRVYSSSSSLSSSLYGLVAGGVFGNRDRALGSAGGRDGLKSSSSSSSMGFGVAIGGSDLFVCGVTGFAVESRSTFFFGRKPSFAARVSDTRRRRGCGSPGSILPFSGGLAAPAGDLLPPATSIRVPDVVRAGGNGSSIPQLRHSTVEAH